MRLQLPVSSYSLRSKPAGAKRLVNCFAEQSSGDKGPVHLQRTPGITEWIEVGQGPIRQGGIKVAGDKLYVVSGTSLYSVTQAGIVSSSLGTIAGTGPVSMDSDGNKLVIVAEPNGYAITLGGGTFQQITDTDFTARGSKQVFVMDSYMLHIEPDSGRWFASLLLDATNYDALYFATAEGSPDKLVGGIADHRQALLFGTDSLEMWFNQGGSGFPFARESNGFIEIGCAATFSIAKVDNSVLWLAHDLTVRRLDGTTPVRISTHAMEQIIAGLGRKDDAYAFTYTQEGHVFYVLTFPEDARTLVYDATTRQWHERESRSITNGDLGRWRPCAYAYFGNRHVVADFNTARLGTLDFGTRREWDNTLLMSWTYPSVYGELNRAFHHSFELGVEAGVGLTLGQGSNPEVMLSYSNDGGRTFKDFGTQSLGAIGARNTRVCWYRLGSGRDRVYRCSVSDPVPVTVTDTILEVEGGIL